MKTRLYRVGSYFFFIFNAGPGVAARILGDQLSYIGPHDIRLLRNTVAKIR
jgi:hypothetical protein